MPAEERTAIQAVLEELSTLFEEFTITEEELRQQHEHLAHAQQALEAERQRYQDLFHFAPDGYLVTDGNGVIREANQAAGTLFRVRPDRLVGTPLSVYLAVDERRTFRTLLLRLQTPPYGTQAWGGQLQLRHGDPFPAAFRVAVMRDPDGTVSGLRWLVQDITERKRAEEAVRRNEAWLSGLIEATQDAVLSIDRQGRIVQFNPAAEQIFGYTKAEVVGQKVTLLMPEPYASEHDTYIHHYEQTGEARAIGRIRTVAAKRKGGEVFPIELSVTDVHADDKVRYGAFIRDISEKVRLQEQVIERERLAAIGTTAAQLGHEIGNPLNSMFLNAQLLERQLAKLGTRLDDRLLSYVRNIRGEIHRLTSLLNEFRALSRRQHLIFRPIPLETLITDILTAETPAYTACGVQVEWSCAAELPPVVADAAKLSQVLLNLCKNAVEAMPSGGILTVRAHNAGAQVIVEISDTGTGIPVGINIFEPFATTKAEGTGLGLPIVQQIVSAHGGTVSYTSTPGQGTTFTVVLPLKPPGTTGSET